jgi:hypothetical protein
VPIACGIAKAGGSRPGVRLRLGPADRLAAMPGEPARRQLMHVPIGFLCPFSFCFGATPCLSSLWGGSARSALAAPTRA